MTKDPVETNPANYRVAFENGRVRVLEYVDSPGHATTEHSHPDSVMVTLSAFRRRITFSGKSVDVELPAGVARWLPDRTVPSPQALARKGRHHGAWLQRIL